MAPSFFRSDRIKCRSYEIQVARIHEWAPFAKTFSQSIQKSSKSGQVIVFQLALEQQIFRGWQHFFLFIATTRLTRKVLKSINEKFSKSRSQKVWWFNKRLMIRSCIINEFIDISREFWDAFFIATIFRNSKRKSVYDIICTHR